MGTITAYEAANGRRYRVRYRKPDHSQTDKRGFRTKRDAEEFLHMVELSKARGSYVDPALARVNVESLAPDWLKRQAQPKPTTVVGYESALSKHIIPRWGRRSLSDIGYAEIQHWISDLSKTLAPQTVRNIYAVFSLVFSFAVRDGRLVRNPAEGIQLPHRIRRSAATSPTPRFIASPTSAATPGLRAVPRVHRAAVGRSGGAPRP